MRITNAQDSHHFDEKSVLRRESVLYRYLEFLLDNLSLLDSHSELKIDESRIILLFEAILDWQNWIVALPSESLTKLLIDLFESQPTCQSNREIIAVEARLKSHLERKVLTSKTS